jgi:hypothetical protein
MLKSLYSFFIYRCMIKKFENYIKEQSDYGLPFSLKKLYEFCDEFPVTAAIDGDDCNYQFLHYLNYLRKNIKFYLIKNNDVIAESPWSCDLLNKQPGDRPDFPNPDLILVVNMQNEKRYIKYEDFDKVFLTPNYSHVKNRKFTEEDPYGEEDWEISEDKLNESKIPNVNIREEDLIGSNPNRYINDRVNGYRNRLVAGLNKYFVDKVVTMSVTGYNGVERHENRRIFNIAPNDYGVIWYSDRYLSTGERIIEIRKAKEGSKLVDPYGEEDWEL